MLRGVNCKNLKGNVKTNAGVSLKDKRRNTWIKEKNESNQRNNISKYEICWTHNKTKRQQVERKNAGLVTMARKTMI